MMTGEERRAAIEAVEAKFLRGLDKDEDEALSLLVERSRLLLYGSLAITAAAVAAASAMEQSINLWLFGGGVLMQQGGAVAAWSGLQFAETLRHMRIVRKHTENRAGLHARFGGEDPLYPAVEAAELGTVRKEEADASASIRRRETAGMIFVSFGFALLVGAFAQALDKPRHEPAVPKSGPPSVSINIG